MENSYYQIAQVLSKKMTSQHFNEIFKQPSEEDPRFEDETFLQAFREMKDKYQVCYKLFGELNFKILVFEYMRNIPFERDNYGHLFGEFLGQIPSLQQMRYIKWIAKLDWFWFADDKDSIKLPKGTLTSWGNLQKGEDHIEIEIDESIMEKLVVKKVGHEYRILAV